MSIIGLVLGIVGLIGGIIFPMVTYSVVGGVICIIISVAGIVLSAIGMKSGKNYGVAVAGLVVSIIAAILCIVTTASCACGHAVVDETVEQIENGELDINTEELESALTELTDALEEAATAEAD